MKITKKQLRRIIREALGQEPHMGGKEPWMDQTSGSSGTWVAKGKWMLQSPDGQLMDLEGESLAMLVDPQGSQYSFADYVDPRYGSGQPPEFAYRVIPRTGNNFFETNDINELVQWLEDNEIENASR
jgi:hypothetical protein